MDTETIRLNDGGWSLQSNSVDVSIQEAKCVSDTAPQKWEQYARIGRTWDT